MRRTMRSIISVYTSCLSAANALYWRHCGLYNQKCLPIICARWNGFSQLEIHTACMRHENKNVDPKLRTLWGQRLFLPSSWSIEILTTTHFSYFALCMSRDSSMTGASHCSSEGKQVGVIGYTFTYPNWSMYIVDDDRWLEHLTGH